jgi:hypothetical protein
MTTEDDKVSRRYRELAREEPPRHVDEAILSAARRAADARPAPLVVPTGRRRWYFPLAAAAVIVLAVAVTVHVERQQRDAEVAEAPVRQEQSAPVQASAEPARPAERPRAFTPDPKPKPPQELRTQRNAEVLADVQKPQAAPAAPAPAPPETSARRDAVTEMREAPQARAAMRSRTEATPGAASGLAAATPEQWLQGIADLKRQGKHEEAERELAEFRKRYPNYRIPETITEKFEKR